uniref:Rad60/SUMO-like domain-containing protein n=1 Tax=Trichuris muris TaxID=70415 RepID=A0A5S6QJZ8_TRIMR
MDMMENGKGAPRERRYTIRIKNPKSGVKLRFIVSARTPMWKVFNAASGAFNCPCGIRFMYKSRRIRAVETPESLALAHEAVFIAVEIGASR